METMHIDIARYIGAVTRTVVSRDHEGKPAKVVVLTRTYDTNAEDLWDAVTTAERLPRWLLPITGDLRLGGRYQLEGNAGGEILACDAPRQLKVTWEYGGNTSWVHATIEKLSASSARLTVEHIAYEDDNWRQFGPGAGGVGWDLMLLGLARHIETKGSFDPASGMAWMMSDEGKAFVRQSSDGWGRAAVAAGTDPKAAAEAVARTTAAYTGS